MQFYFISHFLIPVATLKLPETEVQNPYFINNRLEYYPDNPEFSSYDSQPGARFGPEVYHTDLIHEKSYGWKERLLVIPQKKFAFCYIEKVACTQFNKLMNAKNGIPDGGWEASSYKKLLPNVHISEITRSKGWFKAVFLREPTYRFLSAYQSKCLPGHDSDQGACIVAPITSENNQTVDRQAHFQNATMALLNYSGGNPHFDSMSSFCGGLDHDLSDYEFVGHLDQGYAGVQKQVQEMLKRVGMEFTHQDARLFPATIPQATSKWDHVTRAESTYNGMYTTERKNVVRSHYVEDYKLLKHGWRVFQ